MKINAPRIIAATLLVVAIVGCSKSGSTGGSSDLEASKLAKIQLFERSFFPSRRAAGATVPCELGCKVVNGSSEEVSKVESRFTLLKGKQVLFEAPIVFSNFTAEYGFYATTLIPGATGVATVKLDIPTNLVRQMDGYWFELKGATGFNGDQDLHNPGHLFTFLMNSPSGVIKAKIGSDPALATTADPVTGMAAIHAIALKQDLDLFKYFLNKGAKADTKSRTDFTPLDAAAFNGPNIVDFLLQSGQPMDDETTDGYTPLMFAIATGNIDTIEALLKKGANVNHQAKKGERPLSLCAEHCTASVLKMILDHNPDLHFFDENQVTALAEAAKVGDAESIDMLVGAGLKVDECDVKEKFTPLMICAREGSSAGIKELLKLGADPNLKSGNGHTARDLAIRHEQKDAVDLLNPVTNGEPNLTFK